MTIEIIASYIAELRMREADRERQKREWEMKERQAEEQRTREEELRRRQQEEMAIRIRRQEEELHRRQQENNLFMQVRLGTKLFHLKNVCVQYLSLIPVFTNVIKRRLDFNLSLFFISIESKLRLRFNRRW